MTPDAELTIQVVTLPAKYVTRYLLYSSHTMKTKVKLESPLALLAGIRRNLYANGQSIESTEVLASRKVK
jgi:protein-disulfide isomerase-like protein with CxxC motif